MKNVLVWGVLGFTSIVNGAVQDKTKSFAEDVKFLNQHTHVIVLKKGATRAAIVPAWQCRVVTSALGAEDPGFGFINYPFIASDKLVPHINVFGGEDRIWLGPEGGQFSIFFKGGSKFDLAHWQTPAPIDSEPYRVVSKSADSVTCSKRARVVNYSGTKFDVKITRTVKLLSPGDANSILGIPKSTDVNVVGYETKNVLTNEGRKPWTEKTGLLSLWVLGQLKHSPTTTVIAPYHAGPVDKLGPVVNDTYFGKVPADRLKVGDQAVFFKVDGKYRSKIGFNPRRSLDVIGSYDSAKGVLTIIKFSKPAGVTRYVNSMWEIQAHPFAGDSLNSYNDGPPSPGAKPLGPFYEVESSSPAAALSPGRSIIHLSRTFHFQGPKAALQNIATKVLGVDLGEVASKFSS
jgi:hypothetical protein